MPNSYQFCYWFLATTHSTSLLHASYTHQDAWHVVSLIFVLTRLWNEDMLLPQNSTFVHGYSIPVHGWLYLAILNGQRPILWRSLDHDECILLCYLHSLAMIEVDWPTRLFLWVWYPTKGINIGHVASFSVLQSVFIHNKLLHDLFYQFQYNFSLLLFRCVKHVHWFFCNVWYYWTNAMWGCLVIFWEMDWVESYSAPLKHLVYVRFVLIK